MRTKQIIQQISFFVRLWQKTRFFRAFFLFPQCRFYPSCSDYFLESINKHGLLLGLFLSIKRIVKCHPLCKGGVDEVPEEITRIPIQVEVCLFDKPERRKGPATKSGAFS